MKRSSSSSRDDITSSTTVSTDLAPALLSSAFSEQNGEDVLDSYPNAYEEMDNYNPHKRARLHYACDQCLAFLDFSGGPEAFPQLSRVLDSLTMSPRTEDTNPNSPSDHEEKTDSEKASSTFRRCPTCQLSVTFSFPHRLLSSHLKLCNIVFLLYCSFLFCFLRSHQHSSCSTPQPSFKNASSQTEDLKVEAVC